MLKGKPPTGATFNADAANVSQWLGAIGVTDAPLTRMNMANVLTFFKTQMAGYPVEEAFKLMHGIDFSKPAKTVDLRPGEELVNYQPVAARFGKFYTRAGHASRDLGINPAGRRFLRYRVKIMVKALASTASATVDQWTQPAAYQASGGGTQLIIPNADMHLEVIREAAVPRRG